jgi:hypothetical protein
VSSVFFEEQFQRISPLGNVKNQFQIEHFIPDMASAQYLPPQIHLIKSDSDSDDETGAKCSQRATQTRKRSAAAAGYDATTTLRMNKCTECNSLCVVQTDQTPSNLGRNVTSP